MEEVTIRVEHNTLGEAKPEVLARVKMRDYHHDTNKFNADYQAVIEALRTAYSVYGDGDITLTSTAKIENLNI
jgi:hypothetical protein